MKPSVNVQVLVKQSWSAASAALLMGGIAKLPSWDHRSFYKVKDGVGLIIARGNGEWTHVGAPTPEEMESHDWVVFVPMTQDALPAPTTAQQTEIGNVTFIGEAAEAIRRQQANDLVAGEQEVDATGPVFEMLEAEESLTFAEALGPVLEGRATAWRDILGFPAIALVVVPATQHRDDELGEWRVVMRQEEGGVLVPYFPTPHDLVAQDWVVDFGE